MIRAPRGGRRAPWRVACALGVLAVSPAVSAWPLRVQAGSALRALPDVDPSRTRMTVRLSLRDDQGAALAGRALSVQAQREHDDAPAAVRAAATDAQGETTVTVALDTRDRTVHLRAAFAGDGRVAGSAWERDVALDAPFVTVELTLSQDRVALGAAGPDARVTVDTGRVGSLSARGLSLAVGVEGSNGAVRDIAAGVCDAAGSARLHLPAAAFAQPGVVRLVPRVQLREREYVRGEPRDVLVQARTSIGLARVEGDDDARGVELRGSLRRTPDAPLVGASVQLLRGDETLAGARTDGDGAFTFRLPASAAARPDLTVRAVFDPTEPWYERAESAPLQLSAPPPPEVPWYWTLLPLAVALGVGVGWQLRARRKEPPPAPPPLDALPDAAVVRVEPAEVVRGLEVVFRVSDRSTGAAVRGAEVQREGAATWSPVPDGAMAQEPARRIEFVVRAPGFAPRAVAGDFARPGRYVVQVMLRNWREALFDRVRPVLRPTQAAVHPTPREALRGRATPAAEALLVLVEAGCYGAAAPDDDALREADRLVSALPLDGDARHAESRR